MNVLEREMNYFLANQKRLAKWYPYSFLVIKEEHVYGGFPSILDAYTSALTKFQIGTFLVIKTTYPFQFNEGKRIKIKLSTAFKLIFSPTTC